MKKTLVLIAAFLFSSVSVFGQEAERLDFNLDLKSNHLWNGIVVTDAPIVAVDINYAFDRQKNLKLGVWGGMGLSDSNGVHYNEINYYLAYSKTNWGIGVWDVFNYTGFSGKKADIWNYKQKTTGHRFDLRGYVVFSEKFPLRLDYVTSFFGNDLNLKEDQNWSTYTGLTYPVIENKVVNLDLFCGGAFSFSGDPNFYANKKDFNIVNVGVKASKDVAVLGYKLPVSATAMWNPAAKEARVQIATSLF